jgi:hypothetical protein
VALIAPPLAGRAESRFFPARKSSLPEVLDHRLLHEVELLKGLALREPLAADAALAAIRFAGGMLGREELRREALERPFLAARAISKLRQRPGGCRGLEGAEEMRELARGAHAISAS